MYIITKQKHLRYMYIYMQLNQLVIRLSHSCHTNVQQNVKVIYFNLVILTIDLNAVTYIKVDPKKYFS